MSPPVNAELFKVLISIHISSLFEFSFFFFFFWLPSIVSDIGFFLCYIISISNISCNIIIM